MEEVWKDIPQYEGMYMASNLGSIKGLDRVLNNGRKKKGQIILPYPDKKGYLLVALQKNGQRKRFCVHSLVAICFIENREHKPQVNHKNGIKSDNNVYNLEWVTQEQNNNHALLTGLKKSFLGELNPMCKLRSSDVLTIRELIKEGRKDTYISKIYGVTREAIKDIREFKNWKHI